MRGDAQGTFPASTRGGQLMFFRPIKQKGKSTVKCHMHRCVCQSHSLSLSGPLVGGSLLGPQGSNHEDRTECQGRLPRRGEI